MSLNNKPYVHRVIALMCIVQLLLTLQISDIVQHHQDLAKVLMCEHSLWSPPKLIKLPHEYSTFFQLYRMTVRYLSSCCT